MNNNLKEDGKMDEPTREELEGLERRIATSLRALESIKHHVQCSFKAGGYGVEHYGTSFVWQVANSALQAASHKVGK